MSDDDDGCQWTMRDMVRADLCINDFEHRSIASESPQRKPVGVPQNTRYYGVTTSAITAGNLAAPTTFTFDVYVKDYSGGSSVPRPLVLTSDTSLRGLTGVNYLPGLVAASGFIVRVEWDGEAWCALVMDC